MENLYRHDLKIIKARGADDEEKDENSPKAGRTRFAKLNNTKELLMYQTKTRTKTMTRYL